MDKEFIVTKKAMRPASDNRECFYCRQAIGSPHRTDCVLIKRRVKVRAVITYDIDVPSFWKKDDIELHRNESSWCAGNMIKELQEIDDESCLCGFVEFKYLEDTGDIELQEDCS